MLLFSIASTTKLVRDGMWSGAGIKNIVLVHGAFVDGSGWKPVYQILVEAGNDSKVAALVYIAAHAPDDGETEAGNGRLYRPAFKSLRKTGDGFDYIDPLTFYSDFSADLPREQAEFMAHSQMPAADTVFHAVISHPAWKVKPSWYMVAKSDRIINPDLERMYAKRAHCHTVEIEGASHSVYESHPKEVAQLIMEAAIGAAMQN